MRVTDRQCFRIERGVCKFNLGKKFVIRRKVPNDASSGFLNIQDPKQTEPALDLKNKVISRAKILQHINRE